MSYDTGITTCVLGAKGSGKSVMLADMALQRTETTFLIDVLGVYNPRNNYKTAVIPHSYYVVGVDNYIRISEKYPVGAKIVIDFSEYFDDSLIEAMDSLCNHILTKHIKCAFISDEIADYMPESARGSRACHRLIKNGRNFGVKPAIIATQRPQSVNKKIFDLCDVFYISQQRAPRTIDYILDIIDRRGDKAMKTEISKLKPREFFRYDGESLEKIRMREYPYAFKQ